MAEFVDSHAHLADAAFDPDRDDVIARARHAGARAVLCIGESVEAARGAAEVAGRNPGFVFFTAGIHPHDAEAFDAERDIPALRALIAGGALAVGECGLDYHYENAPRDRQRAALDAQLELAREAKRPLVLHTRDAVDDTRAFLDRAARDAVGGVLHCFTGPRELGEAALAAGWYLSFSGVITFRNWRDEALLRLAPADRLLVESDAPYLAPVPHRGRRNESAWVSLTLARLAEARGVPLGILGAATVRNAARLFALPLDATA